MTKLSTAVTAGALAAVATAATNPVIPDPRRVAMSAPTRRPHTVQGAKFRAASFFRATQMSEAMARAGVIPGTHLVTEQAKVAISAAGWRTAF